MHTIATKEGVEILLFLIDRSTPGFYGGGKEGGTLGSFRRGSSTIMRILEDAKVLILAEITPDLLATTPVVKVMIVKKIYQYIIISAVSECHRTAHSQASINLQDYRSNCLRRVVSLS